MRHNPRSEDKHGQGVRLMLLRLVGVAGVVVALGAGCATAPRAGVATEPAEESPPATSSEDWMVFPSVEDLADASELVVIGTAGEFSERFEFIEVDDLTGDTVVAMGEDLYEFTVERVLAGALPDDDPLILVGLADFGTPSDNAVGFEPGDQVLLFLAAFDFDGIGQGWVPLSSDSGIWDLVGERVVAKGTVGPTAGLNLDIREMEAIIARVVGQVDAAVGDAQEIPSPDQRRQADLDRVAAAKAAAEEWLQQQITAGDIVTGGDQACASTLPVVAEGLPVRWVLCGADFVATRGLDLAAEGEMSAAEVLETQVRATIAGTSPTEQQSGLWSVFEGDDVLNGVSLEGGDVTVDFNDEITTLIPGTSSASYLMFELLYRTLFQFAEVESVTVTMNRDCDTIGDYFETGCFTMTRIDWEPQTEADGVRRRALITLAVETTDVASTIAPLSDQPVEWYAATEAGAVLSIGPNRTPLTLVSQGELGRVRGVQRAGDRLLLDLCCEPAEGTIAALGISSGSLSPVPGYGRVGGADESGRWLRVLTNGHQLILEDIADGQVVDSSSSPDLLLGEAALSPETSSAAVVGDNVQGSHLYVVDLRGDSLIEAGVLIAEGPEDGVAPTLPAIDALGRVWYVMEDRPAGTSRQGVIADAASGDMLDHFTYPADVIDQNFDATGSWLLITYADGTVGWRSLTGESGLFEFTDVVAADW